MSPPSSCDDDDDDASISAFWVSRSCVFSGTRGGGRAARGSPTWCLGPTARLNAFDRPSSKNQGTPPGAALRGKEETLGRFVVVVVDVAFMAIHVDRGCP